MRLARREALELERCSWREEVDEAGQALGKPVATGENDPHERCTLMNLSDGFEQRLQRATTFDAATNQRNLERVEDHEHAARCFAKNREHTRADVLQVRRGVIRG